MSNLVNLIRKKPLIVFVIATFTISWSLWYLAGVYNTVATEYQPLGWRWLLAQVGVYAPAVVGVMIGAVVTGGESVKRGPAWIVFGLVLLIGIALSRVNYIDVFKDIYLQIGVIGVTAVAVVVFARFSTGFDSELYSGGKVGMGWILASVALIPAVMAAAMLAADRKITISPVLFEGGSLPGVIIFGASLFAFNLILGGSLGEEPGWRGFALPWLLERYQPLQASLILGVIWAVYHAPIDLAYGFMGSGIVAILARLIWTLPLTLLFTYFFMNTNGSLLIAILLHTSVNFAFEFFQPGNEAIGIFSISVVVWFVISFLLRH